MRPSTVDGLQRMEQSPIRPEERELGYFMILFKTYVTFSRFAFFVQKILKIIRLNYVVFLQFDSRF